MRPLQRPGVWLALLVIAAIGVPIVHSALTGAIDIPLGDDWAYSRVAQHFVASGQLQLVGWGSMFLAGHILWAAPFQLVLGNTLVSLHVAVIAAGIVALACAYVVASSVLTRGAAAIACASVAFFPGFGLLTVSYMTDVTALAAQLACLALATVGLRQAGRRRTAFFAAALVIGVFGFTIRETALAAPLAAIVAFAAARWTRGDRRGAGNWAGGLVLLVGVCGAAWLWRRDWPGTQAVHAATVDTQLLFLLGALAVTAGLALLPAVILAGWRPLPARVVAMFAAASLLAAGLIAAYALRNHRYVFAGNILTPVGYGGFLELGQRPRLFPHGAWLALSVVGVVALAAVLFAILRSVRLARSVAWRRVDPTWALVLAFTALSLVAVVGAVLSSGLVFDRYLLAPVFGLSIVVLAGGSRTDSRWRWVAAGSAAVALWALSIVISFDADSYDHARWSAATSLVRAGYPPRSIDAGFEWSGYHSRARTIASRLSDPSQPTFYAAMLPDERLCIHLADSPEPAHLIRVFQRADWLGRSRALYAYAGPIGDSATGGAKGPSC